MRASACRALLLVTALGAACVTRTRSECARAPGDAALRGNRLRRQGHRRRGAGDPGRSVYVGARGLPVDQLRAQPGRGRSRYLHLRAEAQGLEDRTRALQPTAAVGPLGVRRSTLDRVADLVSGARADEPHHEVEDEPYGRELQDPQGQSKQATEDAEEDVERDECQGSEKREAKNAAKHGRIPPCGPTLGPYVAM